MFDEVTKLTLFFKDRYWDIVASVGLLILFLPNLPLSIHLVLLDKKRPRIPSKWSELNTIMRHIFSFQVFCLTRDLFCTDFAGIRRHNYQENWVSSSLWLIWGIGNSWTVQHGYREAWRLPHRSGPLDLIRLTILLHFTFFL